MLPCDCNVSADDVKRAFNNNRNTTFLTNRNSASGWVNAQMVISLFHNDVPLLNVRITETEGVEQPIF